MAKKFPLEISEFPENLGVQYPEMKELGVLIGPKKFCFSKTLAQRLDDLYNFEVRPDDVWVFGVPRSGTTLAQEMVWLLGNNLDYEKAAESIMDDRFPIPEQSRLFGAESCDLPKERDLGQTVIEANLEKLKSAKGRRFMKTHLPLSFFGPQLLQSGCKIFYLARNPRDVCVSQYHFSLTFGRIPEDTPFATFWNYFKLGIYGHTNYFDHVKEGWDLRNNPNFKLLYYDQYSMNLRATALSVASFLGVSLNQSQLNGLLSHLDIENFRKNKSVNNDHLRSSGVMKDEDDSFIRKGKRGGWKDYFIGDLRKEADQWIEDNLKRTGIDLPM